MNSRANEFTADVSRGVNALRERGNKEEGKSGRRVSHSLGYETRQTDSSFPWTNGNFIVFEYTGVRRHPAEIDSAS